MQRLVTRQHTINVTAPERYADDECPLHIIRIWRFGHLERACGSSAPQQLCTLCTVY